LNYLRRSETSDEKRNNNNKSILRHNIQSNTALHDVTSHNVMTEIKVDPL